MKKIKIEIDPIKIRETNLFYKRLDKNKKQFSRRLDKFFKDQNFTHKEMECFCNSLDTLLVRLLNYKTTKSDLINFMKIYKSIYIKKI